MSKAQSRIIETPREYEGEKEAGFLVNWLNATKDAAAKDRIVKVIRMFMLLANYEVRIGSEFSTGKDGNTYETATSGTKARDHVARQLDRALDYYTMRPRIYLFGGKNKVSGPSLVVGWTPISGSKMHRHQKTHYVQWDFSREHEGDSLPGTQMAESGAIKTVLELMQSGSIFKIELCRCGNFFYKRFSHQKFCSSKCRLADFRDSEESRRKRNEYARRLYRTHKALDTGGQPDRKKIK